MDYCKGWLQVDDVARLLCVKVTDIKTKLYSAAENGSDIVSLSGATYRFKQKNGKFVFQIQA